MKTELGICCWQGWGAGKCCSGSGSSLFFQAAPAPRGQKHPAPTSSGSPALVAGSKFTFFTFFFEKETLKIKLGLCSVFFLIIFRFGLFTEFLVRKD